MPKKELPPTELTPEEQVKMSKSRILSDAELIKGGADATPEGGVVATEEQKKDAKIEMGENFYQENIELKKRLNLTEKNILDCQPGHWETLAEPITLKGRMNQEEKERRITIPAGLEINNLGLGEHDNMVRLKVSNPEKPGTSFWLHCSPNSLQRVTIKTREK